MLRAAAVATAWLVASFGYAHADEIKLGGTGAAQGTVNRLAEAFERSNPSDKVVLIGGLGSGGGIVAVSEGALDLAVSSRELKPDERAKGLQAAPMFETPFVFVTSHPERQNLSKTQVVAIFDEALTAWPDGKAIKIVLRPKSDTVTSYLHANFEGMQAAMDKLRLRRDIPVAPTDQDSAELAEKTPNSFAAATLAQIVTEGPRLRLVDLDGRSASVEAMESGSYPLKLKMLLISKQPSPAANRFIQFLRSDEAKRIFRESGSVSLLDGRVADARSGESR